MTNPGDRYVGYLPPPTGERQSLQPNWSTGDGRPNLVQTGFQRDGSFRNARGESISLQYQNDGGAQSAVDSFRITANGRLLESGTRQDGTWQTSNGRWNDLENVRTGVDRNTNEGFVAFDRQAGKTEVWKASGRQFTTDGRRPPMDINTPTDRGMGQPVTRAVAPDGSVTDYHYSQLQDSGGFRSQLQSYDVRDRDGNIKEFSCRNNDGNGSYWITFKPQPGEPGLFSNLPRQSQTNGRDQESAMRQAQATAANPEAKQALPPELAGRAVNDPYKQVYAESLSRDGHRYETGYNGEKTCNGDDGKTYHWHANGMQSITRTLPGEKTRMLASDTGTAAWNTGTQQEHGLVKDHYGYDQTGRINNVTETSVERDPTGKPLWQAQYKREGNQWEVKQGDQWTPSNVDIKNHANGSVTISELQHAGEETPQNRPVSARTIYPDGGETVSALTANGHLKTTDILSATGDHTVLHYDQQGRLSGIEQSTVANDSGAPTTIRYSPNPSRPGHWQRVTETAGGTQVQDLPAEPTVSAGEVDFGQYGHIDHRGDLSYAERMARRSESYRTADAGDNSGDGEFYPSSQRPTQFRMPRWMLPPGARPSDLVDAPGHRMSPVGYEGSYYPVVAQQPNNNAMPWTAGGWNRGGYPSQVGYPAPIGVNYYARRERPFINIQFRI